MYIPLTGKEASLGKIEKNSLQLALEEFNKAGGVNGRLVDLVVDDDGSKVYVGQSALKRLISLDKVIVIGGGYASNATFAMCLEAQQSKIPFVVTTAPAEEITERRWDFVFRLSPPADEYHNTFLEFATLVVQPKTVAILYVDSPFGRSSAKSLAEAAETHGLKVVLKEGYDSGSVDLKPIIIKTKSLHPDVIYMVSYVMDGALLMRQCKELDLNAKCFVGVGASFTGPEFARLAGDAAEDVFSTTIWSNTLPYPGTKDYFENYRKAFKEAPDYHGAQAYATMQVIGDALKRAKELTPAGVREALCSTDLKTVFGPVKFISYGNKTQQNRLPTYLVQWQKGIMETVWPKGVSTKPYVYPIPLWKK